MKKTITKILCAVLFLAGTFSGFALDVNGTPPTFNDAALNSAVSTAFNTALGKLRDEVRDIDAKPKDFIQSWGNAAIFASHGATQRAYGDYKLFSFTIGPMIGLQLPGDPFQIADNLDNLADKLNQDRDIKLGISPQIFNARLGINTSKFLLDNLYLGVHLGFIKLKEKDLGLDGFSYENFSFGVTANYQIIQHVNVVPKILLWRGVNLGSGLIFQTTKINYAYQLDTYSENLGGSYTSSNLTIDPRLILDMNINTVTIPLEATTAVKLLSFLNIPLGVGVDLGFGKSDIKIGMDGKVNVTNTTATQTSMGKVSVNAGGDMAPSFFNLKFMTGIGINIGPVLLDVPITFYAGNGYSVGITVGAVW